MKPLVSILIPALDCRYNQVSACAKLAKKEIIIVDDGSTDQTLSIARQFASKTVSVIAQKNQGAAAARNKAFQLCQAGDTSCVVLRRRSLFRLCSDSIPRLRLSPRSDEH